MIIIAVAALSTDNAIGKDNGLLWDLPKDQVFLKAQIQDNWILSGRVSYESALGSELFENRKDIIVMTRDTEYQINQGSLAHSLEEALQIGQDQGIEKLCVLGGAAIYERFMEVTHQLILTRVHATFPDADTHFPPIDPTVWKVSHQEDHFKDTEHAYDFSFVYYERADGHKI